MKYSIILKNSSFDISESLAKTLKKTKNKLLFKTEIRDKRAVFILKDSALPFFNVVKTISKTHFYALILNKKRRINSHLYLFILSTISYGRTLKKVDKVVASPLI